jgi:hypothetical protein
MLDGFIMLIFFIVTTSLSKKQVLQSIALQLISREGCAGKWQKVVKCKGGKKWPSKVLKCKFSKASKWLTICQPKRAPFRLGGDGLSVFLIDMNKDGGIIPL